MNNLYNKIYEAVDTGIQKALIISDDIANDVSVKWYEKEKITNFIPYEYRFVDMGLESGLLWAEYNIGAFPGSKAENWYGNYYAWGETETKNVYLWTNYKYYDYNGADFFLIKYNTDKEYGIKDDNIQLAPIDDAATQILGTQYRMPTKKEFNELLNNTTNEWIENYKGIQGLNGRLFTSKINGKTLFFPAAGFFCSSNIDSVGSYCYVWSVSLSSDYSRCAWDLYFGPYNVYMDRHGRRYGRSVRAVYELLSK